MVGQEKKYAIRFGLGAIKAVGINMMHNLSDERSKNGEFKDIYDLCSRIDSKAINKKSIEALAKSGALDGLSANRRQLAESFDILSSYSNQKKEAATSNQMSLFGSVLEIEDNPPLKNVEDWNKEQKLQSEFEAFGFFLAQHPLDDYTSELKKRGVIFSNRIDEEDIADNSLVKLSGVISSSKHRSGSRGRFCYLNISDPLGIFEVTIFDENLITAKRDVIVDGSLVVVNCLIRKDEGGTRIMVREVEKLEDFIAQTPEESQDFEDIVKQKAFKKRAPKEDKLSDYKTSSSLAPIDNSPSFKKIELSIDSRDRIYSLKSLISNFIALDSSTKTQIIINVNEGGNNTKILLKDQYLVRQSKIEILKRFDENLKYES